MRWAGVDWRQVLLHYHPPRRQVIGGKFFCITTRRAGGERGKIGLCDESGLRAMPAGEVTSAMPGAAAKMKNAASKGLIGGKFFCITTRRAGGERGKIGLCDESGLRAMPAGEVTSAMPGPANCQHG
jgi:hypothetical protein